MATYLLQCDECGHQEDFWAPMSEAPVGIQGPCPMCSQGELWRVYGVCAGSFVKGTRKNSRPVSEYDQEHRPDVPITTGVTPDEYEKAHEADFAYYRKQAEEVEKRRRGTRRSDDEFRHVGSVPFAQFLSRQREADDLEAPMDLEYWKSQGRIFDHEKDRVEEE